MITFEERVVVYGCKLNVILCCAYFPGISNTSNRKMSMNLQGVKHTEHHDIIDCDD